MIMERKVHYLTRKRLQWEWYTEFDRRRYDWMGTLTAGPSGGRISFELMNKKVVAFLRKLSKEEGLRLAGYYALCRLQGRVHVHFLLLGRQKNLYTRKTLRNVDHGKWENRWPYIASIEPIDDDDKAHGYLAAQQVRNAACEIVPYNVDLLNQAAYDWEHRGVWPPIGSAVSNDEEDD